MKSFTVHLPWPPKALSPNARSHWGMVKARAKYRKECGWNAIAAGLGRIKADELHLTVTFFPPDDRKRDRDNCIGAFKSGQDSIADVTGIDDSRFLVTYAQMQPPIRPRGMVKVELSWDEAG